MGGISKIVKIIIASIAVVLFLFALMPKFFFIATASQVSPPVDPSFAPLQCGGGGGGAGMGGNSGDDGSQNKGTKETVRPEDRSKTPQLPDIDLNLPTDEGQPAPVIEPGLSDPGSGDC